MKTRLFSLLVLALSPLALLAQPRAKAALTLRVCVPPPADLVSWWPGEGNANDVIGGHNGTLLGGTSFAAAEVGQGFGFDSDDDRVTIPHSPALDVAPTGFAVEFWMRGTKNQPQPLFLVVDKSHGWTDGTGWVFQGDSSSGLIIFGMGKGGNTGAAENFPAVASTINVLDGTFHHVAGTWDGSAIRLYVDGVFQSSTPITTPANNTRNVNLGFSWGGGSPLRFFRGQVDELALYSRALSAAEIQSIYQAGSAGKCSSPPTLARIISENFLVNGQFHLTLSGQAGARYIIDASSNLSNWLPITTNTADNGTFEVTDPDTVKNPQRFYRARLQQ